MTVQPTRDQLRALADAATEGPWEAGRIRPLSGPDYYGVTAGDEIVASLDMAPDMSGPQASMDSDFIAAARTAVPHLLDHLDQAEAELDSWMARAYEAEKRAWQAEAVIRRQERYIEELESVDVVGLKARAQRAEARIKAVRDVLETAYDDQVSFYDIRRALDG